MTWQIMLHPQIVQELQELPVDMKAKLTRILEMIQHMSPFEVKEPHVKSLGNKLWEIRLSGRDGIARVLYAVLTERRVALLRAFVKKTQKTPKREIECAFYRLQELGGGESKTQRKGILYEANG